MKVLFSKSAMWSFLKFLQCVIYFLLCLSFGRRFSGHAMFGLSIPIVQKLIQSLPDAEECVKEPDEFTGPHTLAGNLPPPSSASNEQQSGGTAGAVGVSDNTPENVRSGQ